MQMIPVLPDIADMRRSLRILEREIGHALDREAECCGISFTQCHFLLETGNRENVSLTELAEILALDISTLSRTADALALAGLIKREPDKSNRRKVSIRLSERGKAKVGLINQSCDSAYAGILALLPPEKRDQVVESIHLLANAFSRAGSGVDEMCACCVTGRAKELKVGSLGANA